MRCCCFAGNFKWKDLPISENIVEEKCVDHIQNCYILRDTMVCF